MDSELLLNELYNDPKISFYFSLLKTSKWRELKKNGKMKFFIKFHSYLCDKLELYKDVLIIDNEHLEDKASNDTKSRNVSYDNGGMIYIQDVFYNHLNIADSIPSIEKYLSENLDNKLVINNINNKVKEIN